MTPSTDPAKPPRPPREPVPTMDLLLLGGTVFFALLLVTVAKWSPDDGQVFQAIATLASGFGASFMTRARPSEPGPKPDTKTVTIEKTDTTV